MSASFPRHPSRAQVARAAAARAVVVKTPAAIGSLKVALLRLVEALAAMGEVDAQGKARAYARVGRLNRAELRRVHHFARRRNWSPTAQGLDLCAETSRACR